MNHVVVVDPSLTISRLLLERFTDQARAFFNDNLHQRRPVFAPPHLSSEVINAIYQRLRGRRQPRYHISEAEADQALDNFLVLPIHVISPDGLYQEGYRFAKSHDTPTIYDSLYVVLAQMLNAELWTADERLYNGVRSLAPWVRFVGDYPLP